MRYLLFVACLITACQPDSKPKLQSGHWTGTLTPMNHPDMANPIDYEVSYKNDSLMLGIVGPDSTVIPTRVKRVEDDSLFFSFNEPEEQVLLDCAFGKKESGELAGRCTDSSGKWALLTMVPPNE